MTAKRHYIDNTYLKNALTLSTILESLTEISREDKYNKNIPRTGRLTIIYFSNHRENVFEILSS